MTYGEFLGVFLLPVLLLSGIWALGRQLRAPLLGRSFFLTASFLSTVAVLYTTPWDNYLVAKGIWRYPPERVWGVELGWVPLEEYLFFVLQSLLSTAWLWGLGARLRPDSPCVLSRFQRWGVAMVGLSIAMGAWMGWAYHEGEYTYAFLILGWAIPVITVQWLLGANSFCQHRQLLLWGISVPTLYLWIADSFAIQNGIWDIARPTSTGLLLFGILPIEEALFFLVTNMMLGLGFVLVQRLSLSDVMETRE